MLYASTLYYAQNYASIICQGLAIMGLVTSTPAAPGVQARSCQYVACTLLRGEIVYTEQINTVTGRCLLLPHTYYPIRVKRLIGSVVCCQKIFFLVTDYSTLPAWDNKCAPTSNCMCLFVWGTQSHLSADRMPT